MQIIDMLLIDQNQLFREGLKKLLEGTEFRIVFEADTVESALDKLHKGLAPSICLLEFDATSDNAEDFKAILQSCPLMKLVLLTTGTRNIHNLARCFEAGADAYLLKNISSEALQQSLKLALTGEKVFPTKLASMLISKQPHLNSSPISMNQADLDALSERELQILRCLLNGYPNKIIAKKLNITEATVKVHLKGILKKINAVNRTQAAIWALNNGLSSDSSEQL